MILIGVKQTFVWQTFIYTIYVLIHHYVQNHYYVQTVCQPIGMYKPYVKPSVNPYLQLLRNLYGYSVEYITRYIATDQVIFMYTNLIHHPIGLLI